MNRDEAFAMIEPVALKDFFITFFASALIIIAGAAYALLYAWSKARADRRLTLSAYAAYAVLSAAVLVLTNAAHFSGYWFALSCLMLAGYFFAPMGIWRLCVKTHAEPDTTLQEDKP